MKVQGVAVDKYLGNIPQEIPRPPAVAGSGFLLAAETSNETIDMCMAFGVW